ncbi:MAG: V-type ATP synthase subunit A [Gammaproteobacteria bacterium]|nr:V-type ATP synthase subunit A [Gammaproteobacteria bacterium]
MRITSLGGPVVRAEGDTALQIHEAVAVGRQRLLGEVIRAEGRSVTVQVYEDTTGLQPGDPLWGSGLPLAVTLGPHLLGGIFDGLLRPLGSDALRFVEPGTQSTKMPDLWFEPRILLGQTLSPGQVLGQVRPLAEAIGFTAAGHRREATHGRDETCQALGRAQKLLLPPDRLGQVEWVAAAGNYAADATICRLRAGDEQVEISMIHRWPVRRPRPVAERLPVAAPLLTGQRIIDALFPVARGGRAAMPGGFGTGKTILQQSIAKWCDADVIVYVGCGERGNEMAEVLHQFPRLEDPRSGRPLIERSVIIANASNMPVAAREASIYSGVTVAEYFRDQGLHVALMADSTSRWAEALRELSGRLGELPAEGGYPAYLGTRTAEFYERAARAHTLSGAEGSVTLIGAVSPPGGDFSEPVTLHTQRNVRCFWPLDRDRARARFYPAIHPLQAYSEDAAELDAWWRAQGHPERDRQRSRFLTLLEQRAQLERMARIVGRDALAPPQRLTLLCADLINEGFLRQSAMSKVDCHASPQRQIAMMRLLDRFFDCAEAALAAGADIDAIERLPLLRRLRRTGEEIGEDALDQFDRLQAGFETALTALQAAGPVPAEPASSPDRDGEAGETGRGKTEDAGATPIGGHFDEAAPSGRRPPRDDDSGVEHDDAG